MTDITKDFRIPQAFIDALTTDDLFEIIENESYLTPRLKKRLFAILDIQNPPDTPIQLMLRKKAK